jgi:uncharacterized membrane protein YphA (DoxX/SURF4 family)
VLQMPAGMSKQAIGIAQWHAKKPDLFSRALPVSTSASRPIRTPSYASPPERFAQNIAAKELPFPEALAYLTYFAESVAAVCLAIGLFTRIAAAMIGIEMLVIVFLFQWQFGYFWTVRGYEFALLWALLCIAIFFKGGGRYSIDRLIGKEF